VAGLIISNLSSGYVTEISTRGSKNTKTKSSCIPDEYLLLLNAVDWMARALKTV
jgi:hypothetical protein